jgi:hypothetical protein
MVIPKGTGMLYAEKHNPFRCSEVSDLGSEDEILLPPIKVRKIAVENMPKLVRSAGFGSRQTESEIWHSNTFAEVAENGTLKELAKKAILKLEQDDKITFGYTEGQFKDKWEYEEMKTVLGI